MEDCEVLTTQIYCTGLMRKSIAQFDIAGRYYWATLQGDCAGRFDESITQVDCTIELSGLV